MAIRIAPAERAALARALADRCDAADHNRRTAVFCEGGGDITDGGLAGYRARAFGFASTCTAGASGAVFNWVRNVRVRAGSGS